jgi:hypothetical protein
MVTSRENRSAKTLSLFFGGKMHSIIILSLFLSGCGLTNDSEIVSDVTHAEEPKKGSIESLDNTLEDMDKMIADMEKMNHNLDAIFKAVTDCKTEAECEALSEKYAREFKENKEK